MTNTDLIVFTRNNIEIAMHSNEREKKHSKFLQVLKDENKNQNKLQKEIISFWK